MIGVLHGVPLSDDLDNAVLTGWPAAKKTLRFEGHPTVIYVRARDAHLEDVRSVLPATVFPEQPGQVQVSRPSDALAAKRATQNTFSSLFLGLAAVALLVGGVGVANTMVISVLERRRDIGLRRALGATRGQIRVQFLTESMGLSLLGALTGTLFGVLADIGYAAYQGWPAVIPLSSVTVGCLGAVLIGMAAGVYPSVRAARLPPRRHWRRRDRPRGGACPVRRPFGRWQFAVSGGMRPRRPPPAHGSGSWLRSSWPRPCPALRVGARRHAPGATTRTARSPWVRQ